MANCLYRHCRAEFEPKFKGKKNEQKFHTKTCRTREWMLAHPRLTKSVKTEDGNGKRTFHYTTLNSKGAARAPILQKTLELLKHTQPTTFEIGAYTGSTRPSSDISELRAQGFNIQCYYVGETESGKRIYRYKLGE